MAFRIFIVVVLVTAHGAGVADPDQIQVQIVCVHWYSIFKVRTCCEDITSTRMGCGIGSGCRGSWRILGHVRRTLL